MKNEIGEWEKENSKQFRIGGVQFFEFCRVQWEEYKQSKELQKQQRVGLSNQPVGGGMGKSLSGCLGPYAGVYVSS